jgi:hypothetical protein
MTSETKTSLLSIAERLESFYSYLRRERPTITETVRGDVEVGVEEYAVDLGQFGEQYLSIEFTEYVEVEGDVEVDLDDLISDGPLSTSDLYDLIGEITDLAGEPETSGASIPRAVNTRETTAGRAALAALRILLAGEPVEAIRRALGEALVESGLVVGSALSYDPLTVALSRPDDSVYVRTEELRFGDDVTGSTFGRLVEVEPSTDGYVRVVLNRDGREYRAEWSLRDTWNILPIAPPEGRENVAPAVE